MSSFMKLATITRLIAEIGDCDELQYSLDGFVKILEDLKGALNAPKVSIPEPVVAEEVEVAPQSDDEEEGEEEVCDFCNNCVCDCVCGRVECVECNDWCAKGDIYQDKYDDYYCESCFRSMYFQCDGCCDDFNEEEDANVYVRSFEGSAFQTKSQYCLDCFETEHKDGVFLPSKKDETWEFRAGGGLEDEYLNEFRKVPVGHWCSLCGDEPSKGKEWRNLCEECVYQHGCISDDCECECVCLPIKN